MVYNYIPYQDVLSYGEDVCKDKYVDMMVRSILECNATYKGHVCMDESWDSLSRYNGSYMQRCFLAYAILRLVRSLDGWFLYTSTIGGESRIICMSRDNVLVTIDDMDITDIVVGNKIMSIDDVVTDREIQPKDLFNEEIWIDAIRENIPDNHLEMLRPYIDPSICMDDVWYRMPDMIYDRVCDILCLRREYYICNIVLGTQLK